VTQTRAGVRGCGCGDNGAVASAIALERRCWFFWRNKGRNEHWQLRTPMPMGEVEDVVLTKNKCRGHTVHKACQTSHVHGHLSSCGDPKRLAGRRQYKTPTCRFARTAHMHSALQAVDGQPYANMAFFRGGCTHSDCTYLGGS
jgi:hypothetical protein